MTSIDVSKTCKPKNLRRAILALLLIAPLVYLFGTQFFALAGAHGEEVLAVQEKEKEYDLSVEYDGVEYTRWFYSESAQYWHYENVFNYFGLWLYDDSIAWSDDFSLWAVHTNMNVGFSDACFGVFDDDSFYTDVYDGSFYLSFYYASSSFVDCLEVFSDEGELYFHIIEVDLFDMSISQDFYDGFSYSDLNSSPYWIDFGSKEFNNPYTASAVDVIDEYRYVPRIAPYKEIPIEQQENYSDTLQNHFFNENNWVSSIGKDVYAAEEVGFKPIGDLIRFIDDNALHLKSTEWGNFLVGYAYYCANVIFIYEGFVLALLFITIPTKVLDYFHKED